MGNGRLFVVAAVAALTLGCVDDPAEVNNQPGPSPVSGAPGRSHYDLNVIGVSERTADLSRTGLVIFVPLWGNPRIMLCESGVGADCTGVTGYAILDRDGTDGEAAFALPNP